MYLLISPTKATFKLRMLIILHSEAENFKRNWMNIVFYTTNTLFQNGWFVFGSVFDTRGSSSSSLLATCLQNRAVFLYA